MSGEEDKIYTDASKPATLIDGDILIDCPTLGDAVVALDNLPADWQIAAMPKTRTGFTGFDPATVILSRGF